MRIVIEIEDSINGVRLNLFNSQIGLNTYKEDFQRYQDVLLYLIRWIGEENKKIRAKLEVF